MHVRFRDFDIEAQDWIKILIMMDNHYKNVNPIFRFSPFSNIRINVES